MKNIFKKITEVHYSKKISLFEVFIFILFFIPSIFYLIAINIKNFLYNVNFLKETKSKPFIICIGNITTGGVGKTPIVCTVANYISGLGCKTAVLSRGYGGKLNNKNPNLIKDTNGILIKDALLTGDEAKVIADNTNNNVSVITCANRVKGANYAYEKLGAAVVIMDDGFSNRKIKKDINILAIDSNKRFGNGFVLPLGPLREPLSEIKRADKLIVVSKSDNVDLQIKNEPDKKYNIPVINTKFVKDGFYTLSNKEIKLESASDAIAFSAIGQPEQFYQYLKDFNLKNTISYNDHYVYEQKDIFHIKKIADKYGAKYIITTQKDAVKLKDLNLSSLDIYYLKIKPELDNNALFGGILNEIK